MEYRLTPLNVFQKASAPPTVTDESFSNLKEDLVAESLPRKATPTLNLQDAETGATSKTWRDKETGKFIYEVKFADQSKCRIEADTFAGLDAAIEEHNAQFAVEETAFESQREKVVHEWTRNFKFGKEYSAICEALPDHRAHEFNREVQEWGRKLFGKAYADSPERLEQSYIAALDSEALDVFEQEAELHRQIAAQDAQEQERSEAKQAAKMARKTAGQAQRWAECDAIENKRLSQTKDGMAELRKKAIPALGGERVVTRPSTGTAQRI